MEVIIEASFPTLTVIVDQTMWRAHFFISASYFAELVIWHVAKFNSRVSGFLMTLQSKAIRLMQGGLTDWLSTAKNHDGNVPCMGSISAVGRPVCALVLSIGVAVMPI